MADTDAVGLDHNPILAYCSQHCHDSYRGHSRTQHRTTDDIIRVIHDAHTQVINIHIISHHDTPHCRSSSQRSSGIAAEHPLDQPTGQLRKPHTNLPQSPEDCKVNHIQKGIQELQYMIHKWTFTAWMTISVILKRTQTI